MSDRPLPAASSFAAVLEGLKAAGEDTRLRLVAVLGEAELTVSDLTEILGQSQPRISRHLKLLADAGLVDRHREASWVFYRRAAEGPGGRIARSLLDLLDRDDPVLAGDRARLEAVRAARAAAAQGYFAAHARQWDEIRRLHVPEAAVEAAVRRAFAGAPIRALLDLGTGTGRMLELFAPDIERGMGVDLSPDMLGVARANLERAGVRNCLLRQSDIYAVPVPRDAFDAVIVHQVLHYLDDGSRALKEAARVLAPGGRLLVVDFAPHGLEFLREAHAHRHLGFARATVEGWLAAAGLELVSFDTLAPDGGAGDGLTVSLWLARDPRYVVADADLAQREIA
ncbi:ubiquinone/menaquinone biosynthesis C-methylase UbiE/DNA-binding transcriptional ArsR family regulator [Xanthobacter sp. SG618]|uniref:ArsR/SmtB family transcription factor n=1 Tax=Xanthobacter sp. SG618 TaxID=2587121 RepID=UPI00145F1458|nr:metalloregulator ArsR/SmtB family transcription factor [Xanthobacter sp. SG618]NMN60343.1 ubiquinone/menaquinone biosynthesis C-methylase UbiE/DNA-binding transcriptional ArsR family regulator [Xanthobacter sp. SG618]